MSPRTAARIDTNHPDVVTAFRGLGCSVQSLAAIGKGCPDLLVGIGVGNLGLNFLVEVKADKGTLTEDQKLWHGDWKGQVAIVRNLEEVGLLVKRVRALFGKCAGEIGGGEA